MMTMCRYDDMIITFQDKGVNHGINSIDTSGVRGHLRPSYNDFGVKYELRSSLLGNVGGGLDKGSDIRYIRSICVFGGNHKGEK